MKSIAVQERVCDCCGSNDLEEIWHYSLESRTKSNTYFWQVRNVVCRCCGFGFVSPSPTEDALEEYYQDSFCIDTQQGADFSVQNRLHIISKCVEELEKSDQYSAECEKTYLEVGSNNCPEFISKVESLFEHIQTVELNEDCNSNYRSLKDIPDEVADVVAAYFVLEHIPNPKQFLEYCVRGLKSGGFLILEVPNLYLYPKDPAGILLHEHVNHFSPVSLSWLANMQGLSLVEISQKYCSRPFGFAAIYQKKDDVVGNSSVHHDVEYYLAKSCMVEGVEAIKLFKNRLENARHLISKAGSSLVVWGANDICRMLIDGYDVPASVVFVDSDPRKNNYLLPWSVWQPEDVLPTIKEAGFLVIDTKEIQLLFRNG